VRMRTQRGAERMSVVSELQGNKMGVISSDIALARSEGDVPFLPLQPSSNSRMTRIKQ
jgi:hypothetical protein